eukprot:1548419-Pyramimonas_sp.AAC.1
MAAFHGRGGRRPRAADGVKFPPPLPQTCPLQSTFLRGGLSWAKSAQPSGLQLPGTPVEAFSCQSWGKPSSLLAPPPPSPLAPSAPARQATMSSARGEGGVPRGGGLEGGRRGEEDDD